MFEMADRSIVALALFAATLGVTIIVMAWNMSASPKTVVVVSPPVETPKATQTARIVIQYLEPRPTRTQTPTPFVYPTMRPLTPTPISIGRIHSSDKIMEVGDAEDN
jgi:hypothetical protein